ncbi:Transcription factor MEE8 [Arabidopsis thaliana]
MNKDEVFLRQWFEILYSLTNPEANSDLRRINNEKGVEKVGQKRSAESRREGKKKRVKTQCVIKSSDKSDHDTLLKKKKRRERIRRQLETLKEITPNCPQSDINAILDCVIEYTNNLRLAHYKGSQGICDDWRLFTEAGAVLYYIDT